MAADDLILEARGVGKLFARRSVEARKRVGADLWRTIAARSPAAPDPSGSEFWALKDLHFTLARGEALGIIGLNGSGKTTLLRMLAGQIVPDAGQIEVRGKTAAMIDLTAGFNVTRSGRDNIFLRAAALGRTREEIAAGLDEIIAFSELADAIDAPVASYSSGMTMRLAFSIMMNAAPDILFIDEILAVGDFLFRQKCLARLREMRRQSSFVMVSHSMFDVRTFCSRAMLLHKGQRIFLGEPEEAIAHYESLQFLGSGKADRQRAILAPQFKNTDALDDVRHFWCDEHGREIEAVEAGSPAYFHTSFTPRFDVRHLVLGVPVWTEDGIYVTGFSTELGSQSYLVAAGVRAEFRLEVPALVFNEGSYISNVSILDGPEFLYRAENPSLEVRRRHSRSWGVVTLPHAWKQLA